MGSRRICCHAWVQRALKTPACTRACLALQILIKGIRSFSPTNEYIIEFYKPLTIIVGSNGAGKTVRGCGAKSWSMMGAVQRTHTRTLPARPSRPPADHATADCPVAQRRPTPLQPSHAPPHPSSPHFSPLSLPLISFTPPLILPPSRPSSRRCAMPPPANCRPTHGRGRASCTTPRWEAVGGAVGVGWEGAQGGLGGTGRVGQGGVPAAMMDEWRRPGTGGRLGGRSAGDERKTVCMAATWRPFVCVCSEWPRLCRSVRMCAGGWRVRGQGPDPAVLPNSHGAEDHSHALIPGEAGLAAAAAAASTGAGSSLRAPTTPLDVCVIQMQACPCACSRIRQYSPCRPLPA